jgi:hypothetical protein
MADEEENPTRLTKSFSARMRRKEKVTRGEVVPDMPEDSLVSDAGAKSEETDEEAALSDEELPSRMQTSWTTFCRTSSRTGSARWRCGVCGG